MPKHDHRTDDDPYTCAIRVIDNNFNYSIDNSRTVCHF